MAGAVTGAPPVGVTRATAQSSGASVEAQETVRPATNTTHHDDHHLISSHRTGEAGL
ncbi:MAG: hypothetical protein R2695_07935 [Acidimicrobiales bacterium]